MSPFRTRCKLFVKCRLFQPPHPAKLPKLRMSSAFDRLTTFEVGNLLLESDVNRKKTHESNMNNRSTFPNFVLHWFRISKSAVLLTSFAALVALLGCDSSSSVEKPKKTYEIDDSPSAAHSHSHSDGDSEIEASSVTLLDSDGWKKSLDSPDAVNQMIAYASTLRARRPQVSTEQQMADRVALVEIGLELEKRELADLEKTASFQMQSQSMLELISAGNEEYRAKLMNLIEKYRKDSNPDFVRSAGFLELTLAIQDYFRDGANDFSNAEESFLKLAKAHTNDMIVVQAMSGMLSELMTQGQREPVISAMRKLADFYNQSADENIKRIAEVFEDRIYLVESKFDQISADAAKGVPGALEKYLETIRTLARRQGQGEYYRQTMAGVRILEQQSLFDDVRELNEILTKTYASHPDSSVVAQVERDIEKGNQRLNLIGNPIKLVGKMQDGAPFDQSVLDNKVVVVFFWSAKDPKSARVMQLMLPMHQVFKDSGFELVGVCIDKDVDAALRVFGGKYPPWPMLFQDGEQPFQKMFDDLGIQMVPYMLLLDQDGNVADIHVPSQDLTGQIRKMLNKEDE